jgi:hypothetical protein
MIDERKVTGVEPVAWRWRGPHGGWIYDVVKPSWPSEPVYNSPPPKAVMITDEMVNDALSVWRNYEFSEPPVRDFSRMRAALTAALSSEAHNG